MPRVTVFENTPSAEPTATTSSPTRSLRADPRRSVRCRGSGLDTCSTARSTAVLMVITRADIVPLPTCSWTLDWLPTTCALVRTVSGLMKKPVPRAGPAEIVATAGTTSPMMSSSDADMGAAPTASLLTGRTGGRAAVIGATRAKSVVCGPLAGAVWDDDASAGDTGRSAEVAAGTACG